MTGPVERASLPGVGKRFTFTTSAGQRLSVLHHRSGRRELFTVADDDPDAATRIAELDEDDARTLAELLGASQVVQELVDLHQTVAGLSIEWLTVEPGSAAAGRTIGQLQLRSSTGVTVVAVLRAGETRPVPGPDFLLEGGDTAVAIASPQSIRRATDLFRA